MLTSVPEYLPNKTESPTLISIGSSCLPFPVATTIPFCGFSFAESGMMIPDAVLVSASTGSTMILLRTVLSALILNI